MTQALARSHVQNIEEEEEVIKKICLSLGLLYFSL